MSSVRVAELRADQRRARTLLLLVALAMVGFIALAVLRPPGSGTLIDLQLAADAREFGAALEAGWLEADGTATCGIGAEHSESGTSFNRLRCNSFVDSVVFVPGYVGLLVFFMLTMSEVLRVRSVIAVHLMCFVPVAMAFFDVAENAMTMRAANDWAQLVLADGTVADVRLASLIKWSLGAVSFALLAVLAARAVVRGAEGRPFVAVAAICSVSAAVLFALGVGIARVWLGWGMLAAFAALIAFVVWAWKTQRLAYAVNADGA